MESIHLFQAAYDRAAKSIAVPAEADSRVKQIYGLTRPKPGINTGWPAGQIMKLVEGAHIRAFEFIRPDKIYHDPVDDVVTGMFGYDVKQSTLTAMHPLDEAFELISSAAKKASDEKSRDATRRGSHKPDGIQGFVDSNFSSRNVTSEKSVTDIISLVDRIFAVHVPSAKSTTDPINDYAGTTMRYPCQPSHELKEWHGLLTGSAGIDLNSEAYILAQSQDYVNDFAAKSMGMEECPSAKAIPILQNRILKASYEQNKLTPGSAEYKNKVKEIKLLNEALQLRKDNLKATEN